MRGAKTACSSRDTCSLLTAHCPLPAARYGLLIEEYLRCCGAHREQIERQCRVESYLVKAAELVKTVPKAERGYAFFPTQVRRQ